MTVLNVFFVVMNRYGEVELITSQDNGCIQPGNIRNAILDLEEEIVRDTNITKVVEKQISIHEIINAFEEDRLIEIIGCSTSSFIQAINKITYRDKNVQLNTNKDSKYVRYLNQKITDIMVGPDSHPWVTSLED